MRRFLLSIMCAMMVVGATFANPVFTQLNKVEYKNIIDSESAGIQNPVAYTADKQVYMAGTFDADFTAATDLSPIATSAYLIKYDADLKAIWNIALQGAATITSITTDENGGVYIAGSLADEVIFQSTDGNNITKEGMKMGGAFTTGQNAAFIAQYDANGVLKAVQTYIPEPRADLVETEMYGPQDGELYFDINKIQYSNGKLYASAIFTGKTVSGINTFVGGYVNIFDFMFADLTAATIFTVNSDMVSDTEIVSIKSGDNIPDQMQVQSATFTVNNNILYTGIVATGNETYKVLGTDSNLSFTFPGDGNVGFGHIISAIDLTTKTVTTKTFEYVTNNSFGINEIHFMQVAGDKLIVCGTYLGELAFDKSIKATGADDIYAVSFNKSDLSINWATTSTYNEGDPTKNEEIFNGATITGDFLNIIGYADLMADHALTTNLFMNVNLLNGEVNTTTATDFFMTGIASMGNDRMIRAGAAGPEITGVTLESLAVSQTGSVQGVDILKDVYAYPNPAIEELHFSATCNVELISLDGKVVLRATEVNSVNVSSLANGMYFVTITKDNAKKTVKILKK